MRYDPATGQKVKVTADDWRYHAWSNRKPSKRKKLQQKIIDAPGEYAAERGRKVAEDVAKNVARSSTRALRPAAGSLLAAAAPYAVPAALAAGTIAAALVAMHEVAKRERILAGERINQISRAFVQTQQEVIGQYGVSKWDQVPADVRNKLLNGYKAAIAEVQVYHPGSLQPSKQIPYGR